jgi:hypothetical protein
MGYTFVDTMVLQELLQALHAFSVKNRSQTVELRQFMAFSPSLASDAELESALRKLAEAGRCALIPPQGPIKAVSISEYYLILLEAEIAAISVDPSKPFPKEETLAAVIPPLKIATVDVKTDFTQFLSAAGVSEQPVAKLIFPEGIDSLIVARSAAGSLLVEAAVGKVSAYLSDPKNAGFVESKLLSILKGNDVLVRQMMEDAATKPKKASSSVFEPSDFAFRFWTYLVNLVLQDFRKKKEKTSQDHGVCQSAYIIGYYAFFRKGQAQKEQERVADLRCLENLIRKPPYLFTFETLYGLADDKGVPFVSKHSHQFIHSFLEEKTKRTGDESLPFMVRIHDASRNKDYFIQKDLVVPVFLKKLSEAAEELHDVYLNDWIGILKRHENKQIIKNDAIFQKDVELRVREGYPLLAALANAPLLYLARSETVISQEAKEEIGRCLEPDNNLRPLAELMGLFKPMLLSEARSYLPLWETMPILRHIVALIRALFTATKRTRTAAAVREKQHTLPPRPEPEEERPAAQKPAATRAAAASERDTQTRYRRALQIIRDRYVPLGKNVEDALDELAEKWNPLFADTPKKDLVEDVNALVRDFLRPVKRTLMAVPPDIKRIQALAEQLSGSKSLSQIKKKEPLKRYLELFMIKCLEPQRKI